MASIRQQSVTCDLVVSDDGSLDGSRERVAKSAESSQSISLIEGPCEGFCANFLSMFRLSEIDQYDYVAWSDQDDLWEPHHLARAIHVLQSHQTPAAFGSRTRLINESGQGIGYSSIWKRPLSFKNALVQSVVGGNTMVMNRSCVQWIQQCLKTETLSHWVSHDWAVYLMLSMAEFPVIWDAQPTVHYRQHTTNLIGANRGFSARANRLNRLRKGVFAEWMRRHISALEPLADAMSPASRGVLHCFADATSSWGLTSCRALVRSGVYRQGVLDQHALQTAALLGYLKQRRPQTD